LPFSGELSPAVTAAESSAFERILDALGVEGGGPPVDS
jgi:hypothetical protein